MQRLFEPSENICEKQICATCNCKIQDSFSRIVNIIDMPGNLTVLYYHYFFPCWDFDLICQTFPNYKIDSAGFSFDSEVLPDPKKLRNMKKNMDLWV